LSHAEAGGDPLDQIPLETEIHQVDCNEHTGKHDLRNLQQLPPTQKGAMNIAQSAIRLDGATKIDFRATKTQKRLTHFSVA